MALIPEDPKKRNALLAGLFILAGFYFFDTYWWKNSDGDPDRALQGVLDTAMGPGFNSAGSYENSGFFVQRMPFVASLTFPPAEIPSVYNFGFDIFDSNVKARFSASIKRQCDALKKMKNLIGYGFVDQPR